jgi:hypothetical protein
MFGPEMAIVRCLRYSFHKAAINKPALHESAATYTRDDTQTEIISIIIAKRAVSL